jgi:hypothetical protein
MTNQPIETRLAALDHRLVEVPLDGRALADSGLGARGRYGVEAATSATACRRSESRIGDRAQAFERSFKCMAGSSLCDHPTIECGPSADAPQRSPAPSAADRAPVGGDLLILTSRHRVNQTACPGYPSGSSGSTDTHSASSIPIVDGGTLALGVDGRPPRFGVGYEAHRRPWPQVRSSVGASPPALATLGRRS